MKDDAQKTAQAAQVAGESAPASVNRGVNSPAHGWPSPKDLAPSPHLPLNPKGETPIKLVEGVAHMENSRGHLVPAGNVPDRDKLEDQLVRGIVAEAEDLETRIKAHKSSSLADIRAFRETCAEHYGVKLGGGKGNVTLTSYDGSLRVTVAVADVLVFNSDLEIAEQLIRECLNEWFNGSRPEAHAIVAHAFRRNAQGQLSVSAVLRLRTLKIDNDKWRKAMEIITEALRVTCTREFVRAHRRNSAGWELINLDIAKAQGEVCAN